ncbi:MAG TPA: tetratricopeptide repeat protein, partial [Syntrophorhabdaceae bacterium]|nr:tetratricopeptide repeat protein [Syntrophorhabdaceae bacterium]
RHGLEVSFPSTVAADAPNTRKDPSAQHPAQDADTGRSSAQQEDEDGRKHPIRAEIDRVIAMQREGDFEGARKALEPLLTGEPGNADVRYLNARLFMADGDMKRAIDELAETVRLDPGHSNALNDLGCMAFQQEKYPEAFESLKRAIVSDRTNYMALQNMLALLGRLRSQEPSLDAVGILRELYPEGFRDIGAGDAAATKRALVIYADEAIPWALGNMLEHFPYLNGHSMWWETAEMVKILNQRGYTVDYIGLPVQHLVDTHWDWDRYHLVIDGGNNNLLKCPPSQRPVKVFYSTGKHWLLANVAEAQRNLMFYRRHGVHMPLERTQRNNFSDENADYLTYFGNESQLEGYSDNPRKVPLNISSACIPLYREKDVSRAKKSYIWLGGQAMVHKGLDLTVEAFARMPEFSLHICANLEIEPRFLKWLTGYLRKCPNIRYHGPQNVASAGFQELAWNSVGTVYVSAAEGGPGSVAQLLHFGIIPIVTRTSNVRAEHLGYVIEHTSDNTIIDG